MIDRLLEDLHIERIDDLPLLLAQLRRMQVPSLLDRHFPTHGNWAEDLTFGEVASVWLAYLDPLGMPLVTTVVAGNTADDPLYAPAIAQVQQSLDGSGRLFVGDCKMAALETRGYVASTGDSMQSRKLVCAHVEAIVRLSARIIADGVSQSEFAIDDPVAAGRALLCATTRFHNPAHAAEWSDPAIDKILDDVWQLLIDGLKARFPMVGSP
jgi:hypothetical protein